MKSISRPSGGLPILLALAAVALLALPAATPAAPTRKTDPAQLPLLHWDLLRQTVYNPTEKVIFPDSLRLWDDHRVRMEGYLMPDFGAQENSDLLLTGIHPRSMFCGPTDMTAVVKLYLPGFDPDQWPMNPVEVTGIFHVSKHPENLLALYYMQGISWRPVHVTEQYFPGFVDDERRSDELDDQ